MKFEKKLIYRNDPAINGEINQLETQKKYFQKLVDVLTENSIEVQKDTLQKLIENPKDFIVLALTKGENLQVGNLKLNNNKLFDLMEVPQAIKSLIEQIEKDSTDSRIREFTHWKVSYFSIVDNCVEISKEHKENIETRHSIFIQNENQLEAFNILENVAKELNKLPKLGLSSSLEDEYFKLNENKDLIVNPQVIRNIQ